MLEQMAIWTEVWPVAADKLGLWLVSGNDAWRSNLPIMADSEPHAEVENLITNHTILDNVALIHSTSWRVDGPSFILTYMAVVQCPDLVRGMWPNAMPISLDLAKAVGKPFPHAAAESPTPRYIDVLMHGLRHLRFLLNTDTDNASALDNYWQQHLSELQPALASMYTHHD
jgi:hypothetical protein